MTVSDTTDGRADKADLASLADTTTRIRRAVEGVIEGKRDVVRLAITVMLAEGHLLIEDVPGVGKTMLAKALARSVDCSVRRVQFTPDLLPSDITGVSIYNQERREFEFKPGAIFANIVVGDEINRASPKTQSALLECMEEHQVTVDGVTYELGVPFMVIATQNPIEMEGTYPLPEAQRDRFMARLSMGYPSNEAELAMLDHHGRSSPLDDMEAVSDATEIAKLIDVVRTIHVSDQVSRYAVDLTNATRNSSELRLGASPRATLAPDPCGAGRRGARRPRLRAARRPAGPRGAGAVAPAVAHRRVADRSAVDRGHRRRHRRAGARPRRRARPEERDLVRDALRGLTTRGRSFLAAGVAVLFAAIVARHTGPDAHRGAADRAAAGERLGRGPHALSPVVVALSQLGSHPGRSGERRDVAPREHLAAAHRAAARRGPRALRARVSPSVRARPHRAARPQRGDLPRALRRARSLSARPARDPAHRPVRHVRAAAVLLRQGHPHRHSGRLSGCRRRSSRASGPAAARAGPARWRARARTTRRPANTARATTCGECTGVPPHDSASSWCVARSSRGRAAARSCSTRAPIAHSGEGPASSFEWAVSAAASIGVHLVRIRLPRAAADRHRRQRVQWRPRKRRASATTSRVPCSTRWRWSTRRRTRSCQDAATALRRGGGDGLLVVDPRIDGPRGSAAVHATAARLHGGGRRHARHGDLGELAGDGTRL